MDPVEYINPETGEVWFRADSASVEFRINSDTLRRTLTIDWRKHEVPESTYPICFVVMASAQSHGGVIYDSGGTQVQIAELDETLAIEKAWAKSIVPVKQAFLRTMSLINDHVLRKLQAVILRLVSEGVAEIALSYRNSGMWAYLHGKCTCVVVDDDAEHPSIADGVLHVPKDLDARSKPFRIDHAQILRLNNDIPKAYDWRVENEKNRATLQKLMLNEEFVNGLPDVEQHLLRALRATMQI